MALPFEPQDIAQHRRRYADAVKETWVIEQAEEPLPVRPGNQRPHVFDFFSGLRLIVSRDEFTCIDPPLRGIHISAGISGPDSAIGRQGMRLAQSKGTERADRFFRRTAINAWRSISGDMTSDVVFQGQSDAGTPHWLVKEAD